MVIIVVDGVGELLVWVMVMGGLFGDTSRGNRYIRKEDPNFPPFSK